MNIYIVRHGETKWNKQKRMQGSLNSDLTLLGMEDANKLGRSLKNVQFKKIYSSSSGRAISTAECIMNENLYAQDHKFKIDTKDLFKEMNFGLWEGMYYHDIEIQFKEQHYNFWNRPELFEPNTGESYGQLIDRARKGIDYIINENRGETGNILLTTHTAFIKAIYANVKKLKINSFWDKPYLYNNCLSILNIDNNNNMGFVLEADISHLE